MHRALWAVLICVARALTAAHGVHFLQYILHAAAAVYRFAATAGHKLIQPRSSHIVPYLTVTVGFTSYSYTILCPHSCNESCFCTNNLQQHLLLFVPVNCPCCVLWFAGDARVVAAALLQQPARAVAHSGGCAEGHVKRLLQTGPQGRVEIN